MIYHILDDDGGVINTIVADQAFVDTVFPGKWVAVEPTPEVVSLADLKRQSATRIDAAAAAVYARVTRFMPEYEAREAQAVAYRDAGYTGTVPPRVDEFATPAGLDATTATNLILSQADALRTALGQLSAQRMRKYEVINAPDVASAQAVEADVLDHIQAIGQALQ